MNAFMALELLLAALLFLGAQSAWGKRAFAVAPAARWDHRWTRG